MNRADSERLLAAATKKLAAAAEGYFSSEESNDNESLVINQENVWGILMKWRTRTNAKCRFIKICFNIFIRCTRIFKSGYILDIYHTIGGREFKWDQDRLDTRHWELGDGLCAFHVQFIFVPFKTRIQELVQIDHSGENNWRGSNISVHLMVIEGGARWTEVLRVVYNV